MADNAKKMVLVPQHVFNNFIAQQQLNPVPGYIGQLSNQANAILQAPGMNNDAKAALYDQMFQQYQSMRNQQLQTPITFTEKRVNNGAPAPQPQPQPQPPQPAVGLPAAAVLGPGPLVPGPHPGPVRRRRIQQLLGARTKAKKSTFEDRFLTQVENLGPRLTKGKHSARWIEECYGSPQSKAKQKRDKHVNKLRNV
jgi:hypothetical protein